MPITVLRGKSGLLTNAVPPALIKSQGERKLTESATEKNRRMVRKTMHTVRVKMCGKSARYLAERPCMGKPYWEQGKVDA